MNTSKGEQYVINEKGNATAVILPIESYKKILGDRIIYSRNK